MLKYSIKTSLRQKTLSLFKARMGRIMLPSSVYEWFIEPLDSSTNEAVSRELSEENFIRGMSGPEGKKLNLWRCSFSFLRAFARSREHLSLDFRAYNRQGGGAIREHRLLLKEGLKRKKAEKTLQDFQQKPKTANHS